MRESLLIKKIRAELEQHKAWVYKTHGGPFAKAGVPDILACYKGRFIGIEAKVGSNKVTKLQQMVLCDISEAGGVARVMRDVCQVKALLEHIDNG